VSGREKKIPDMRELLFHNQRRREMKRSVCLAVTVLMVLGMLVAMTFFPARPALAAGSDVISYATKPVGTAIYFIASGMVSIFNKYAGLKVTLEPTTSIKQWGPLMDAGQIELAMDNAVDTGGAYRATKLFEVGGKKLTGFRMLAAGHETLMTFWTRPDTGIKTIPDFAGKRVVIDTPPGAPTSMATGEYIVDDFYKMRGKYRRVTIGSPTECTSALIEGKIDVYHLPWGPHAEELNRSVGARTVPISKEACDYAGEKVPGMHAAMVPKGMYGLTEETPCVAWRGVLVASEKVDPELIYKIMTTLYSHLDELHAVHPLAKEWVLENATKNATVPFHPGAIKFYKEKGVWTPELEKLQERFLAEGK
jgi:uncharacterized protein